jgi:hypothetical protein
MVLYVFSMHVYLTGVRQLQKGAAQGLHRQVCLGGHPLLQQGVRGSSRVPRVRVSVLTMHVCMYVCMYVYMSV